MPAIITSSSAIIQMKQVTNR